MTLSPECLLAGDVAVVLGEDALIARVAADVGARPLRSPRRLRASGALSARARRARARRAPLPRRPFPRCPCPDAPVPAIELPDPELDCALAPGGASARDSLRGGPRARRHRHRGPHDPRPTLPRSSVHCGSIPITGGRYRRMTFHLGWPARGRGPAGSSGRCLWGATSRGCLEGASARAPRATLPPDAPHPDPGRARPLFCTQGFVLLPGVVPAARVHGAPRRPCLHRQGARPRPAPRLPEPVVLP